MIIPLKHSNTRWVKYQDAELLIDYISDEHFDELEILKYEIDKELREVAESSIEATILQIEVDKKKSKANEKKLNELYRDVDYKLRNPKILKYYRTYIQCSIKDWKGIIKAENE